MELPWSSRALQQMAESWKSIVGSHRQNLRSLLKLLANTLTHIRFLQYEEQLVSSYNANDWQTAGAHKFVLEGFTYRQVDETEKNQG